MQMMFELYQAKCTSPELATAHCLLCVASHFGRIKVDGAALGFENLIAPAADLRSPFFSRFVEDGFRLLCIQHYCARVPAVFDRQRIQLAKQAR